MSTLEQRLSTWKSILIQISGDRASKGKKPTPPASEELISSALARAKAEKLQVDDDYVAFLRTTNGLSWLDGINFCGIDPGSNREGDYDGEDFFRLNRAVDRELRAGATLFGTDQGADILRSVDGKYRTVDGGGNAVFDQTDSLLELYILLCRKVLDDLSNTEPLPQWAIEAANS